MVGTRKQDVKEVPLNLDDPDAKVLIGSSIPEPIEQDLIKFLKIGMIKEVKLPRNFAPERNQIIQEDVEKLLKTGMIKEMKLPRWVANAVVIQKNNGK